MTHLTAIQGVAASRGPYGRIHFLSNLHFVEVRLQVGHVDRDFFFSIIPSAGWGRRHRDDVVWLGLDCVDVLLGGSVERLLDHWVVFTGPVVATNNLVL